MQPDWQSALAQIARHKGKLVGTLLGLVLGYLTIRHGLFKALIVTAFLVVGYRLGKAQDDGEGWRALWDRWIPRRWR